MLKNVVLESGIFFLLNLGRGCIWKKYLGSKIDPRSAVGSYYSLSGVPNKITACNSCIGYKQSSRKANPIVFIYLTNGWRFNCVGNVNGYNVETTLTNTATWFAELPGINLLL